MNQSVARRDSLLRFHANILGLFSGIALLLAAAGILGLMNFSVTDRFHEIGIRVTLGASRRRIPWLVAAYGLKVAVAGLAVGILGALAATRLIAGLLFGMKPWDPLTDTAVALFLLTIAMAACLVAALRAARGSSNCASQRMRCEGVRALRWADARWRSSGADRAPKGVSRRAPACGKLQGK